MWLPGIGFSSSVVNGSFPHWLAVPICRFLMAASSQLTLNSNQSQSYVTTDIKAASRA
jgi:hypothetical protein